MTPMAAYARQSAAGHDAWLVEQHLPLVKRIAHHLSARLPEHIQVDDLIQSGMVGLLEAVRNYESGHGATFETFAGIRIRGAMLDEVRRHDWTPRSIHRRAREVAEAIQAVERREGREAQDSEVAEYMDIPLESYHRILRDAGAQRLLSLDEPGGVESDTLIERLADSAPAVDERLQREDLQRELARAIDTLPERERLILALYYDETLNLREIGAVIGVSESRVCQIHGRALLRLRAKLADWVGESSC